MIVFVSEQLDHQLKEPANFRNFSIEIAAPRDRLRELKQGAQGCRRLRGRIQRVGLRQRTTGDVVSRGGRDMAGRARSRGSRRRGRMAGFGMCRNSPSRPISTGWVPARPTSSARTRTRAVFVGPNR